jgi:ParB-like chromosome segregation protein Spo0J
LWQKRIDQQLQLMKSGQQRRSPIIVTPEGVIVDGHHAVRAAADLGAKVDVLVQKCSVQAIGSRIQDLPVR